MIDKFAVDIFRILYHRTEMCAIIANDDRVIHQCNPAFCAILERNAESLIGQTVDSLMPIPLDDAHYEGMCSQLKRDGITSLTRHVFVKADGTNVLFMARVLRIKPDVYFIILFPDYRMEVNYENASLRRINDELIKQVLYFKQQIELQRNRKAFPLNVTSAERKIAANVAQGKTTEEIAEETCRSVSTIKNHRRSLRKKLNLNKGHSLLAALREYGLL